MEKIAGSFRDPAGSVYTYEGRILRHVKKSAGKEWEIFRSSALFRELQKREYLQQTIVVSPDVILHPESVIEILEHVPLPAVSYPFEWSFSMLRDAGIFHLELLAYCLERGYITKDGSSYNIQFLNGKPIFIDPFSFVPYREGDPWVGFSQFSKHFLFPLLMSAHTCIPFHPLLRDKLDGIDLSLARKFFSWRDIGKSGVAVHILLQSMLQSEFQNVRESLRHPISSSRALKKKSLSRMIQSLESLLRSLPAGHFSSQWERYVAEHRYNESDYQLKKSFVEQAVMRAQPDLVCDLGANTGDYTLCAAQYARNVIAVDFDYQSVDVLYQRTKASGIRNILPLVFDCLNPSPGSGWKLQERLSFFDRVHPDMVFALALMHHMVIGANIPLEDFVEWLMNFAPTVVLEFVDKKDPKVCLLLKEKDDIYAEYTQEELERIICLRGSIIKKQILPCGTRTLYLIERMP